jgi:hypothetical protein
MPKRPKILIEAQDDRIVLDFKKHPKLQNGKADRILGIVTQLVTVRSIVSDPSHVDVGLGAFPEGVAEALNALRRAL